MTNKLPLIFTSVRICVICEGDEEYEYLSKLISLDVWSKEYCFYLENAEGNGNIPARYQDKYQNGSYELVLIFCDTDRKPYEQYIDIKRKLNEFHGIEGVADQVIIYGNPCTMQIIIEHWDHITLSSHKKKTNAPILFSLTGVNGYKGRSDQRQKLFSQITRKNYEEMKERIKKYPSDDMRAASTNFGKFIDYFSSNDKEWITIINEALEGKRMRKSND